MDLKNARLLKVTDKYLEWDLYGFKYVTPAKSLHKQINSEKTKKLVD